MVEKKFQFWRLLSEDKVMHTDIILKFAEYLLKNILKTTLVFFLEDFLMIFPVLV